MATLPVIILFIIFGIILSTGKGSSLIAGYNTLSEKEKKKYDAVRLSKFMGKMLFLYTGFMGLWVLSDIFEINSLLYIGLILFIGLTIFILIFLNTGNRFKK